MTTFSKEVLLHAKDQPPPPQSPPVPSIISVSSYPCCYGNRYQIHRDTRTVHSSIVCVYTIPAVRKAIEDKESYLPLRIYSRLYEFS